jgi:Family of unknown function (DUF6502)
MGNFLDRATSRLAPDQQSQKLSAASLQDAARKSLAKWLGPLSAFVVDCGLSVSEINSMLRIAAIHTAAVRQLEECGRINISGIAAITGIPRGEVSRTLKSGWAAINRRPTIANRILGAWHRDPQFLTHDHYPRKLKIFGSGPTFESLVGKYGHGIPVRAVLDEFRRTGAIKFIASSQELLPRMLLAISPRVTCKKIKAFDAAVDALFSGLTSSDAAFAVRLSSSSVWSGSASLVRRDSGPKAVALLRKLQKELVQGQVKHSGQDTKKRARLSITVAYVETLAQLGKHSTKNRRNFHRDR